MRLTPAVVCAVALFGATTELFASQGAQRLLYTTPNSTFIEQTSGEGMNGLFQKLMDQMGCQQRL